MPGPKMGPRPLDFDEDLVRQSPTYLKWLALPEGQKLRYACREFVRGRQDDDERLMRRIMIARRNNIRDHQVLKKARAQQQQHQHVGVAMMPAVLLQHQQQAAAATMKAEAERMAVAAESAKQVRVRRPASTFADAVVEKEMDVSAVEKTRSYCTWSALTEGQEFLVGFYML